MSRAGPDAPLKGIAWLVAGIAVFSIQDVIIKSLSDELPVFEFIFLRTAFSFVPLALLVRFEGGWGAIRMSRPDLHAIRGVLLVASYAAYFIAIGSMPLADAVALFFSSPLFVTLFAMVLLGERVGIRRWLALAIGFTGVLIMLRPGADMVDVGALFATLSAVVYGFVAILTRRIGQADGSVSMVFSQSVMYLAVSPLAGLILSGVVDDGGAWPSSGLAQPFGPWLVPSWRALGLIALCGLVAIAAFYGLVQAYRIAPPSRVTPFEYTGILWGVAWGYALWGEVPDAVSVAGIVIVAGSGLYLLRREALAQRAAPKESEAPSA